MHQLTLFLWSYEYSSLLADKFFQGSFSHLLYFIFIYSLNLTSFGMLCIWVKYLVRSSVLSSVYFHAGVWVTIMLCQTPYSMSSRKQTPSVRGYSGGAHLVFLVFFSQLDPQGSLRSAQLNMAAQRQNPASVMAGVYQCADPFFFFYKHLFFLHGLSKTYYVEYLF